MTDGEYLILPRSITLATIAVMATVSCGSQQPRASDESVTEQISQGRGNAGEPVIVTEPATVTAEGPIEGMEFVQVPSGDFEMGRHAQDAWRDSTQLPVHTVAIQGFELMTTEVTQMMWQTVMGTDIEEMRQVFEQALPDEQRHPGFLNSLRGEGPSYPMYYVSWDDCQEFIAAINLLDTEYEYRLPSEAEWEYACRSGSTSTYHWGDNPEHELVGLYCWYVFNTNEDTSFPVGEKLPNAWGLYDMSGNVWEWCQDYFHDDYAGAPSDGSPWLSPVSSSRIRRGGAWDCDTGSLSSSSRGCNAQDFRSNNIGFRLARTAR
ncbi:MAG: formylglycine-generating enzyme family protein [Methanotrichaceae archaeon]|nr:formylglycine-generating enzyme family protein [Methanotrichaceae archaeon]